MKALALIPWSLTVVPLVRLEHRIRTLANEIRQDTAMMYQDLGMGSSGGMQRHFLRQKANDFAELLRRHTMMCSMRMQSIVDPWGYRLLLLVVKALYDHCVKHQGSCSLSRIDLLESIRCGTWDRSKIDKALVSYSAFTANDPESFLVLEVRIEECALAFTKQDLINHPINWWSRRLLVPLSL